MRRARHQLDQAISAAEREVLRMRSGDRPSVGRNDPTPDDSGMPDQPGTDFLTGAEFGPTKELYLEAGIRIIKDAYSLLGEHDEELDDQQQSAPFGGDLLAFLTPTQVCERAGRESVSSFYAQWPQVSGGREAYVLDLLRYMFRHLHSFVRREERESIVDQLEDGTRNGDIAQTIYRLTAEAIKRDLLQDTLWYLQLTLSASLHPRNPQSKHLPIRQCIQVLYRAFDDYYQPQYQEFLQRRQLKLRGGLPLNALTDIIGALSEGLALRHQAEDTEPAEHHNLFGLAVLALINSLVIHPDFDDGESIEDMVNSKFRLLADYLAEN